MNPAVPLAAAIGVLAVSGCAATAGTADGVIDAAAARVPVGGRIGEPALGETSGLAASPSGDAVLWAINDSGNAAVLYALDTRGSALARVALDADNRDWEALDGGSVDGIPTLLIGDTGDNLRSRREGRVLLVAEPDAISVGVDAPLPVRTLRFRYPDGAHDIESLALADEALWMLDKPALGAGGERRASGVYRIPLSAWRAGDDTVPAVERVGDYLAPSGGLAAGLAASVFGVDLGYPTALDLDAERGHAWVLTYQDVLRYDRQGAESWAQTLAREPASRRRHGLHQAEALTVFGDGAVVYTSEGRDADLQVIDPP